MTPRLQRRPSILGATLLAGIAALVLSTPAVASAEPRADRGGPRGHEPAVTEDNDNNDGGTPNNVEDAGDNRHPSGRDRSVERGGSGNQGASTSDPDGDTNGGADKPGGAGGVDKADQDGNNGCGNDDDFEDDNKGRCLGRLKSVDEPEDAPDGEPVVESLSSSFTITAIDRLIEANATPEIGSTGFSAAGLAGPSGAVVLGSRIEQASKVSDPEGSTTLGATGFGGARVLGAQIVRGALALTGSFTSLLIMIAIGMVALGMALRLRARRINDAA